MVNRGASPLNPYSDAGRIRLLVGDTSSEPLDPPEAGFADYAVWSDDALNMAASQSPGSYLRAAGYLFLQLAAEYAQSGKSIKTDDLAINTLGRGTDLLKVAQSFLDEATANENAAANDFFQIVPFAGRAGRTRVRPEGTPWPLPQAPQEWPSAGGGIDGGSA